MKFNSSSWAEVTLGEICEFKYGKSLPETKRAGGEVPVYGSNGIVGYHDAAMTNGMTIIVGRKGSLGEVNLSQNSCWAIDTTYYIDQSATNADLRWLACQLVNLGLTKLNKAAAVPGLNREDAYRKKLLLPPLVEQKRIAAILDKAEELRGLRRQVLEQLDSLAQSIFLEMFGDPNLPERTISDLLESKSLLLHKDGNYGSLYPRPDDFGDIGIPFLSAKSVTDDGLIDSILIEYLREEKGEKLKFGWINKGDVLLAHNASVGKVAFYDGRFERALIGTSLTAFRPNCNILEPHYLTAALRSQKFQQQLMKNMGQTTRNQVPITAQRELSIVEPPLLLQQEFSRRIQEIEQLKTTHRESLNYLTTLFASLQHHAFRGEL